MNPAKKFKRRQQGFTLVETITILVVIALLIIFSYISAPSVLARARDAKRKFDIKRIAMAIDEYYEDTNCYPIAIPTCTNPLIDEDPKLLPTIPCDPQTKLSYVYVSEDSECPAWFQFYGILEYEPDPIIDRVGCRNGCGPGCQFNYGVASTNQKLNPFCEDLEPSPSPDSTSAPEEDDEAEEREGTPLQYVCAPAGRCEVYVNPERSGCPDIFPNDPTCQDQCEDMKNWCHDERGKFR